MKTEHPETILLIHPPVAKPSEPPAGVARLSGALSAHGLRHEVVDLNLECLLNLLAGNIELSDTWTSRAAKNRGRNTDALRTWRTYSSIDRYRRTVNDLHRLLHAQSNTKNIRLSFSDYRDSRLSPLKSSDLLKAMESFQDNLFYPYFSNRLFEIFEKGRAHVVGLSLNYLSQALCTFAIIGFIKKMAPETRIILGGGLVTSWLRSGTWREQFQGVVDRAVAGAGEAPLLSLLGVHIQENYAYCPSFLSFPLEDYCAPGPILPYSSSAGCYWGKCLFCPEKAEGNRYIPIAGEVVTRDLGELARDLKPVLIHLVDNAVSPAIMEDLCARPPGIPWYGFARLTRHLAEDDFCLALRHSGCVMLKLGLESGSQTVLDAMKKGNELSRSSGALKSLTRAGIATYVYLLFGTPWETRDAAYETLEFVAQHSPYISFLNVAVFNLPAKGPDAGHLKTTGFYEGDLTLYTDFLHPSGWDRKHVKQFLDKEFRRHPAIQPILRRNPPGFGSNHAPFFSMQTKRGWPSGPVK